MSFIRKLFFTILVCYKWPKNGAKEGMGTRLIQLKGRHLGNRDVQLYHIAENFQGRKLSWISRFCGYTRKFSLRNLGRGVLRHGKSEQSAKVFSAKIGFSPIRGSFLPWKFPAIRYQANKKCKIDDTLEVTGWSQVRGQSVHSRRRALGYSARGYHLTLFVSYNKRLEVFVKS